jgi:hypothetical protein
LAQVALVVIGQMVLKEEIQAITETQASSDRILFQAAAVAQVISILQ